MAGEFAARLKKAAQAGHATIAEHAAEAERQEAQATDTKSLLKRAGKGIRDKVVRPLIDDWVSAFGGAAENRDRDRLLTALKIRCIANGFEKQLADCAASPRVAAFLTAN